MAVALAPLLSTIGNSVISTLVGTLVGNLLSSGGHSTGVSLAEYLDIVSKQFAQITEGIVKYAFLEYELKQLREEFDLVGINLGKFQEHGNRGYLATAEKSADRMYVKWKSVSSTLIGSTKILSGEVHTLAMKMLRSVATQDILLQAVLGRISDVRKKGLDYLLDTQAYIRYMDELTKNKDYTGLALLFEFKYYEVGELDYAKKDFWQCCNMSTKDGSLAKFESFLQACADREVFPILPPNKETMPGTIACWNGAFSKMFS